MVSRKMKAALAVKLCYHIFHSISIVLLSTIYVSLLYDVWEDKSCFLCAIMFSFHQYCVVEYL